MAIKIPPMAVNPDGTWQFGNLRLHQCEGCCTISIHTRYVPSRTMYHWDGTGPDPNRDILLCPECEGEYNLTMDSWWADAINHY